MSSLPVHVGFWHDYPSGSWVLTLNDLVAFIVVSVVVLLVNAAGEAVWTLIRHTTTIRLEHHYATLRPGLKEVYDRILRPGKSSLRSFLMLLYLGRPKKGLHKYRWFWLLTLTTSLLGIGVPALSIASSYFLTAGTLEVPHVIANKGSGLQHLWIANVSDETAFQRDASLNLNITFASDAYYSSCYEGDFATDCITSFTSQSLPYTVTHGIDTCPFSGDICAQNDTNDLFKTFRLETPWLQLQDIGINSRYDLQIKKAMECAPISAKKFCTNCDSDAPFNSETYYNFVFGEPSVYRYAFFVNSSDTKGYRISSYQSIPGDNIIDVRLQRNDGTTTIMWFNAIGINYVEPIADPLFYADEEVEFLNVTYWQSHYWVTALGCVDQMRISNNRTGNFTPWLPPETVVQYNIYTEDEERSIGLILGWAALKLSTNNIVSGRGSSALRAIRSLTGLTQTTLAQNQTQIEASAWFGTSLAKLQLSILSIGRGDKNFNSTGFIDLLAEPNGRFFRDLGSLVKFVDGNYSIIKAAGIVAIVIIASVLSIAAIAIEVGWPLEKQSQPVAQGAQANQRHLAIVQPPAPTSSPPRPPIAGGVVHGSNSSPGPPAQGQTITTATTLGPQAPVTGNSNGPALHSSTMTPVQTSLYTRSASSADLNSTSTLESQIPLNRLRQHP